MPVLRLPNADVTAQRTRTLYRHRLIQLLLVTSLLLLGSGASLWTLVRAHAHAVAPTHTYLLDNAHQNEWQAIGRNWLFHDNIVESRHSDDRGAKLLTGSSSWANYTLTADLHFNSDRGDTGVVLRTQDEQNGVDSYNGYYVGLRKDGGTLIIGRSNYGWVEARPVPLPGGFQTLAWYRLRVTAFNCNIGAVVENLTTQQSAWVAFEERKCVKTGRIGLRAVDVDSAWRNIRIAPATFADYLEIQQHTGSVERPVVLTGPPWWTPWHIAGLFAATLISALLLQLCYYRFQQWKTGTIMHERQRLAHDIHDTMAQNFAGLGYHIQGVRTGVLRGSFEEPQQVADQLSLAYQLIRRCHTEASETIASLGSGTLASQEELSRILADDAYRIAGQGITLQREVTGNPHALNLRVANALQHIGREAIANAVTHSGLTQLTVSVHYKPRSVELRVRDDGKGFACGQGTQGFGILGMQKRARDVHGTFAITSAPGNGTEIRVFVALHPDRWHAALLRRPRAFWTANSAETDLGNSETQTVAASKSAS